jgi:hypothetical protein
MGILVRSTPGFSMERMMRRFGAVRITGFVLVACGLCAIRVLGGDSATTRALTPEQRLESWWEDLEKQEPQASRALLGFAGKPEESVAFLKGHLVPLKLDVEELNSLLIDLGSDDEAFWKPAFEKLKYLDPRLAVDLPILVKEPAASLGQTRLVEVLCDYTPDYLAGKTVRLVKFKKEDGYNFVSGDESWWAEHKVSLLNIGATSKAKWTRANRAIALLEHFGTPEAVAILKDMVGGHADAQPTKLAQEAVNNVSAGGTAGGATTRGVTLESAWDDLEKPEPQASRALLFLAGKPAEATAFLKEHLTPLKLSVDELNALLTDLGSDDEAFWRPAFEKLRYLDPRLAVDLPTLMKEPAASLGQTRLVEVLCDYTPDYLAGKTVRLRKSKGDDYYNFVSAGTSWWAEHKVSLLNVGGTTKAKWTRAARAIALLEHFGTPEAVAILKDMAGGHADAQPTKLAQEALNNLAAGNK